MPKAKALGETTVTPPLVELFQLLDGSALSFGSIYRKLAPVRTVVDFMSNCYATTPWKTYRWTPEGRPELRDHPMAVLLRNPNPDLTEYELKWRLIADLLVYGQAYWRKVIDGRQKFLVPLPPYRVTPRGGELLRPSAFDYFSPSGRPPQRFSADEIVQFKLYDPEDPRIGSSKIEAIRAILLEEIEANAYRRGFWGNNAALAGVLTHPEQLSSEAKERLRTDFDNTYAGHDNSGRTAVLEEGMKWEQISSTAREAEFMEGRQFVLEATARAYNFPLPLLSLTETNTYASQRVFKTQLYTETMPPWYELTQAAIELQLLPWFTDTADVYLDFVVESKLRGDYLEQADILNNAIGRQWMTVEEGRGIQNMRNRNVPEDAELVVPVGPNYALEGMAEDAALATVTPITEPAESVAASLLRFFDRQERSVVARIGAGHAKAFDRARWDRELATVLGSAALAAEVNTQIETALATGEDPQSVVAAARRRAALSA